jgi:hypothetical protein
MSNGLYDLGRQAFLEGNIAWLTANIKCVLVDTGLYTPNLATHQFLSDIPSGARIATSGNLANKTSTAGVADADDPVFASVGPAGTTIEAMAVYVDTGVAGTSRLIAYIDTATGLPVTANGADITVVFDSGSNRLFKL